MWANKNHMPLQRLKIDWGDKSIVEYGKFSGGGNFLNYKPGDDINNCRGGDFGSIKNVTCIEDQIKISHTYKNYKDIKKQCEFLDNTEVKNAPCVTVDIISGNLVAIYIYNAIVEVEDKWGNISRSKKEIIIYFHHFISFL